MLNFLLNNTPLLYLTQSLWRDEAFSILVAEKPISTFIGKLNFEPPVYYLLLHIWIKLFGTGEIAARALSLVGFMLATCVVIFWAEHVFKKHWLSWFLPIFFFLNPMLLYYAFEIRAYGWFMFFATLSLYAYTTKKYRLLAVANILAFYTHSYAIFLPAVEALHFLLLQGRKKSFWRVKNIIHQPFLQGLIITGLAITPWIIIIVKEMTKLKSSWYFPVDLQLVASVVGNMFVGYDGTPGGLWGLTALLSVFLLGFFILAIRKKLHYQETSFLFLVIALPLSIIIGISFKKPLFVNRYLIYVTIAEVLLITYALFALRNSIVQKVLALLLMIFVVGVDLYLPAKKAKLDIRSTIMEANVLRGQKDLLYVTSPLILFEAMYYTKDRQNVYLYNPDNNPFPWYVGELAFSPSQMVSELPEYPKRAYIVGMDRTITLAYKTQPIITPLINTSTQSTTKP